MAEEMEFEPGLPQDEEEAHFFFTLRAFEDLISEYGMEHIMEEVSDETYMDMFDFFMPPDVEEEELPF